MSFEEAAKIIGIPKGYDYSYYELIILLYHTSQAIPHSVSLTEQRRMES
jgi:hypothetical protein